MVNLTAALKVSKENTQLTEKALSAVYRVILPSLISRSSPGWGPGPLSTERSWEFFTSLAIELGEVASSFYNDQDRTNAQIRRVERGHREEAAGELVTLVRRMPTPIRVVVEARACKVSWRRLSEELPDRAYFSMREDWQVAVGTLAINHMDTVRRLS